MWIKEREILRDKNSISFLSIMMAKRAHVSTQWRSFHDILLSETILDMLQDEDQKFE
jgi:hypothetical protein